MDDGPWEHSSLARTHDPRAPPPRHATRRYAIAACLSTLICSLTYQLLVTVLLLACVRARARARRRRSQARCLFLAQGLPMMMGIREIQPRRTLSMPLGCLFSVLFHLCSILFCWVSLLMQKASVYFHDEGGHCVLLHQGLLAS
jgi:hypothetical protein